MRCAELEELLSAYANSELSRTQKEFIEEHIANCADCREELESYTNVRRQIVSLRDTGGLQDIKEATMSAIKGWDAGKRRLKRLRPALAAVPVVAALAVLLAWQPWNPDPGFQSIMVKAQAATASLQSYRISLEGTTTDPDEETFVVKVEIEFAAPDRYHVKQTGDEDNLEYIFIGDKQYFKNSSASIGARVMVHSYSSMLTREYTLSLLDFLIGDREFPDEMVDGTLCLHYRGTLDYERQLIESWSSRQQRSLPPLSDEAKEKMLEEVRSMTGPVINLWIGKDDYLVRQMKWKISADDGEVSLDFRFYDFNQVIIEAPTDSSGNLLSGWTSTSPEYPHFGTDIRAKVDNYDPSDRKVNFAVNINNISTETLTDVDVRIRSVFPEPDKNPDSRIWFRWENRQSTKGPFILEPGESLEYSCTFGYDATSVSPETIAETIGNSYVEVSYFAPDGQQKMEIFHFEPPESIYTLSTDLPPHLVPVELSTAGEYRLEEEGATYTGGGVAGEINGKEYLFVLVNTQGAEIPAPPGILILDIEDKSSPKKVSFLGASDETWYFKGPPVLSGTVLYISTDIYLWVIDVSDPSAPIELSKLPGLTPTQMIISGEYAFINDGNHDIVTLDISDPAHPEKIANLPLSSSSGFQLHLYGNYLFTEVNDIFYTIDASTPSSLRFVSEYSFDAYHVGGIALLDSRAYIALDGDDMSGISILDISEPENPRKIASLELKNRRISGSIFASGGRVYVFTRQRSSIGIRARLNTIDVSDPVNPVELGYGIMPDSWDFFPNPSGGSHQAFNLIDDYLYWFIGNPPNKPVIETFDLSGLFE